MLLTLGLIRACCLISYSLALQRWSGSNLAWDFEQLGSGHVTWEDSVPMPMPVSVLAHDRSQTVNCSNDSTTTALISTLLSHLMLATAHHETNHIKSKQVF